MNARAVRKAQDSKSEILKSALELIRRSGAPSLTIDAVAEESGFSKGGVLYNFPTKDALIRGMVEYLGNQFEAEIAAARPQCLKSSSPTLRAMIDVTEGWLMAQRDVARAMLATKADRPELSEPFIEVKNRLKAAIEAETDDHGKAWAIWASLEGLHFSEAHSVSVFSDAEQAAVFEELRRRLDDGNN
ncbi:MAG: TetR/AcrR family transcriptional regulator [Roseibium sp.]|uniref:TetR/AcrR family transcriptional regulator n=1 Tax=Roseibium sp. TaxID=1936156 RepID=UPI001B041CA9|nr:TetR/AcrR family transcriptional regulator [Roseibium sp.]MBO6509115.1 TetR/AcrR family transcriptional regulator [Roseibium sp.]MBO6891196.1 TetR/AcrR family transcriptional regulator [Roseibium sp.]MBO6928763.1 TetR/AcrR family transcriptional regulator [Roseibium sp.]